ncbi:MAG: EamA family transporter RarD [Pseudomonadota bacterium]
MNQDTERRSRDGVIAAVIAYTLWGFMPVYFLFTLTVTPVEMLSHRIFWSVPFGALIIALRGQWREVAAALRERRKLMWLALAAFMIAVNWLVYIFAVQNEQIFQASLGYYINPLIYVLVGVVFFGDKLRRLQLIAVALAFVAVVVLTINGGEFPTIALMLGVSFTGYGVIRKQVAIGGMPGLFIETLVLLPFAALALAWFFNTGSAVFAASDTSLALNILIVMAGPVTVLPLLAFALAARRLTLSTIGFLQFIGPSLQFMVGYLNGEALSRPRLVCFVLIWTAVVVFCVDSIRRHREATATLA